jgi:hypothetical protein
VRKHFGEGQIAKWIDHPQPWHSLKLLFPQGLLCPRVNGKNDRQFPLELLDSAEQTFQDIGGIHIPRSV